jgi:hypothetical protein
LVNHPHSEGFGAFFEFFKLVDEAFMHDMLDMSIEASCLR